MVLRLRRRRAVGALDDDLGLDRRRVLDRDLILERRGDEDVDVEREEVGRRSAVRRRETRPRSWCCCTWASSLVISRPFVLYTPPFQSVTATILAPCSASSSAETEPTLPKPCTATVAPLMSRAEVLGRFTRHDHDAAAGGFAPPERAAHLDRLAGHDGRRGVADVHRVGVHHPRHDLLVGVDVRRRHVLFRTDRVDDFGDVAPRQRFDLALATSCVGSQITPPLPPPNGMCATAHFHVIHAASAVTSSSVTPGW